MTVEAAVNPRIKPYIGSLSRDKGLVTRFADLPTTAQDAMIHYMSVDGAAWAVEEAWSDWKWGEGKPCKAKLRRKALADIRKFRHRFVERWGDEPFGLIEIPTKELINLIAGDKYFDGDLSRYKSDDAWFNNDWEYDFPTWPVILSSVDHETLEDGWTRFSRYCKLGADKVPCLFYID